ncbi:MAG: transposase [Verrucomicrobia bacterium]|nr:transposase [Verrucomicrobiota bacterium]
MRVAGDRQPVGSEDGGAGWAAKELSAKFWKYQQEGWARRFFRDWFGWVSQSRLKPVIGVSQLLKCHLDDLLRYLKNRLTNAVTEGLNSKIQSLKAAAQGFRSFRNYRIRIPFFCGKLDFYPLWSVKKPFSSVFLD